MQILADIGKIFMKEAVHAAETDKAVFLLAPPTFIAPMIASFAVLPFSPLLGLPDTALATGIIYLVAMSSLDVIGIIMVSWGSNNPRDVQRDDTTSPLPRKEKWEGNCPVFIVE